MVTEVDPAWFAAWATAVGAAATAITGVVIAFQTIATRRSVQVSQAVQLQSARARLDARAPRLSVSIGEVRWPPHRPADHDITRPRGAAVAAAEQFHLPGDASLTFLVEATGQLRNDGEHTVTIEVTQPLMPWPAELELPDPSLTSLTSQRDQREEGRRSQQRMRLQLAPSSTLVLAPGAVEPLRLCQKVSIADLAAAASNGTSVTLDPVRLIVDDGFDEGVTDTHTFTVAGAPMTPVPGDSAGYTISGLSSYGAPPLRATPAVISRRYFFSKAANTEIPT